jgi:hypothetical protein
LPSIDDRPAVRHENCVVLSHDQRKAATRRTAECPQGRSGGKAAPHDRTSVQADPARALKEGQQSEARKSRLMSWIDQLIHHLEQVTCSGCGEYYRGGDIAAVVTEPARLIVRLRCRSCGQDGIAILDFGTNTITAEPITADDVLDAHDLLAHANRPPAELFPALAA